MKINLTIPLLLLFTTISFGQQIETGEYDSGLKLAFDNKTNKLTGYFENYAGWDDVTNNPVFSCLFYIEGTLEGNIVNISTHYPSEKSDDNIPGTIVLVDNNTVKIKLSEEHGGCWNVTHFADQPVQFSLEQEYSWIQIRFINTDKTYFYDDKSLDKKQSSYIVQNDFVCVSKIEDEWAYCTYYGKQIVKGWIRTADLNKI